MRDRFSRNSRRASTKNAQAFVEAVEGINDYVYAEFDSVRGSVMVGVYLEDPESTEELYAFIDKVLEVTGVDLDDAAFISARSYGEFPMTDDDDEAMWEVDEDMIPGSVSMGDEAHKRPRQMRRTKMRNRFSRMNDRGRRKSRRTQKNEYAPDPKWKDAANEAPVMYAHGWDALQEIAEYAPKAEDDIEYGRAIGEVMEDLGMSFDYSMGEILTEQYGEAEANSFHDWWGWVTYENLSEEGYYNLKDDYDIYADDEMDY